MNLKRRARRVRSGFTLVEVMVSMALIGIVFTALCAGFSCGLATTQLNRQNLRATQLMLEKMETIRLYTWSQINTPGFVPASFSAFDDPTRTNGAPDYRGTVLITNAPMAESYTHNLRQVTVEITWTSGDMPRNRRMSTLVSQYGIQNYIY